MARDSVPQSCPSSARTKPTAGKDSSALIPPSEAPTATGRRLSVFHHLIPAFTTIENVMMPMMIAHGRPGRSLIEPARELLRAVEMEHYVDKKPGELAGGQQQVAIVRALITRPALLLADEPTGNLDTMTAAGVFDLFRRFNAESGCAVLVVTHDPRLSDSCDRTIELVDGFIVSNATNAGNDRRARA